MLTINWLAFYNMWALVMVLLEGKKFWKVEHIKYEW